MGPAHCVYTVSKQEEVVVHMEATDVRVYGFIHWLLYSGSRTMYQQIMRKRRVKGELNFFFQRVTPSCPLLSMQNGGKC